MTTQPDPRAPREKFYVTRDLARLFRVSEQTVRDMVRRGALPAPLMLSKRTWRFDREAVDRFLEGRKKPA
jgi:excisionase family DNA binding protein